MAAIARGVAGGPVIAGQPLQQRAGPQRLRDRVDPIQARRAMGDRELVVAGQVRRLGGAEQHCTPVQRTCRPGT